MMDVIIASISVNLNVWIADLEFVMHVIMAMSWIWTIDAKQFVET